eukprot:2513368-Amphidinium_carterae.1
MDDMPQKRKRTIEWAVLFDTYFRKSGVRKSGVSGSPKENHLVKVPTDLGVYLKVVVTDGTIYEELRDRVEAFIRSSGAWCVGDSTVVPMDICDLGQSQGQGKKRETVQLLLEARAFEQGLRSTSSGTPFFWWQGPGHGQRGKQQLKKGNGVAAITDQPSEENLPAAIMNKDLWLGGKNTSEEEGLAASAQYILVDSGATHSVVKPRAFEHTECQKQNKEPLALRCIDGTPLKTHGTTTAEGMTGSGRHVSCQPQ